MAKFKRGDLVVQKISDPHGYRVGAGKVMDVDGNDVVVRWKTKKGTWNNWNTVVQGIKLAPK